MSNAKKTNNPAEDLMESLLKDIHGEDHEDKAAPELLGLSEFDLEPADDAPHGILVTSTDEDSEHDSTSAAYGATSAAYEATSVGYESTRINSKDDLGSLDIKFELDEDEGMNPPVESLFDAPQLEKNEPIKYKPKKSLEELLAQASVVAEDPISIDEPIEGLNLQESAPSMFPPDDIKLSDEKPLFDSDPVLATQNSNQESERTLAIASPYASSEKPKAKSKPVTNPAEDLNNFFANKNDQSQQASNDDRTIAVTGFQNLKIENHDDKVKVSIGQNRSSAYSAGYQSWGGGAEASLGQAENLRIAQEKILDLERENEKLRSQNDELISASDIIKERSDLLTAQITEFKNDKEGLEESFKNEVALLKGHLHRKETEFQKAQIKVDDLESRLKFDMKKIRVRERELENRLELIRAEKNAVTKSKDDQILDLRRKMDVLQMEVESYRQKCVDLNKLLENNQDSFKRTTRALRLAMANLELQEENKVSVNVALKKVD